MRPPLDRPTKSAAPPKAWDPFDDSDDDGDQPHPALNYKRPPGLRAVHGGVLTAIIGFGVLGLYAAFWFAVAFFFRTGTLDWMEAEQRAGRIVTSGPITVGGFPFDLRLSIATPAYGLTATDGTAWLWEGERLVLNAKPWLPGRVTAVFDGPQTVTQTGAGGTQRWQGTSDHLAVTYAGVDGFSGEMDITVRGLRLTDGADVEVASIRSARVHYLGHDDPPDTKGAPTLETAFRLDGVRLPPAWATPLGRDISGVEAGLGLTGALDPMADDVTAALAAWRDGGGTVEVSNLGVRYGPLQLGANGTVALDGALQPIGAFTVRAEGFFELIDALWRRGVVAGPDAVTAKVVLGAFAKQRAGEARASISLPITVQGRKLYAGPVPLMTLPLVDWPKAPVAAPEPAPAGGDGS